MSSRISLAQQLAQLDQPAPVDYDPEDVHITNNGIGDASEEHSNAGREHYLNVGPSTLRSQFPESLADPKYEGVRVSRKRLEDNDDNPVSDDFPTDTGDMVSQPVTSDEETEDDEEVEDGNPDVVDDQEDLQRHTSKAPEDANTTSQVANDQGLSSTLKRAREEERKKGKAVARQLILFDSLLDARIRLQKCGASMNKLPEAAKIPVYPEDVETREAANKFLYESLCLADDLFDLQEKLIASNERLHVPTRKRRKIDPSSETSCDWEEELQESSSHFSELEAIFHPHLLATLQKWSNKVLAIAPSALLPSSRTRFSDRNSNQVKSAVQLVDEALLEREKLVARTQIWRGTGIRLGAKPEAPTSKTTEASEDVPADIFDDTDFYQSLLRDVIDARSGSGGASAGLEGITAGWRASQQGRKKARQKAIDTRASKGRKLCFEVHEKLQNFMAPAPRPGGSAWHEEQIDELFSSLLGKGFPDIGGPPEESRPGTDVDVEVTLRGGFRVFG